MKPARLLPLRRVHYPPLHSTRIPCSHSPSTGLPNATGYPESVITPDKRLRDDLNLDSIKVGELVVLMVKRANRNPKTILLLLANATLTVLVETLLQEQSYGSSQDTTTDSRQIHFKPSRDLANGFAHSAWPLLRL